jgi:hypothetical protein
MKPKNFFTKNNPNYVGPVVSDTPRANGSNTLLGQPTINKVGGQKRMLTSKKSSVKWY